MGGLPSTKLPRDVWNNGFGGIAQPCIAVALREFVVALLGQGNIQPNSQPVQKSVHKDNVLRTFNHMQKMPTLNEVYFVFDFQH